MLRTNADIRHRQIRYVPRTLCLLPDVRGPHNIILLQFVLDSYFGIEVQRSTDPLKPIVADLKAAFAASSVADRWFDWVHAQIFCYRAAKFGFRLFELPYFR